MKDVQRQIYYELIKVLVLKIRIFYIKSLDFVFKLHARRSYNFSLNYTVTLSFIPP